MDDIRPPIPEASTRFIHLLRRDMRDKGYAYKTEKTYVHRVTRYIQFHGKQHPERLGAEHINRFLSYLANEQSCAPATQRIALNALIYLYRKFLQLELAGKHPSADRESGWQLLFTVMGICRGTMGVIGTVDS